MLDNATADLLLLKLVNYFPVQYTFLAQLEEL